MVNVLSKEYNFLIPYWFERCANPSPAITSYLDIEHQKIAYSFFHSRFIKNRFVLRRRKMLDFCTQCCVWNYTSANRRPSGMEWRWGQSANAGARVQRPVIISTLSKSLKAISRYAIPTRSGSLRSLSKISYSLALIFIDFLIFPNFPFEWIVTDVNLG